MMVEWSQEENDRIVKLSDEILKTISQHDDKTTLQTAVSSLADALIYLCQKASIEKTEFKNICQQVVNEYDEIFIEEDIENS